MNYRNTVNKMLDEAKSHADNKGAPHSYRDVCAGEANALKQVLALPELSQLERDNAELKATIADLKLSHVGRNWSCTIPCGSRSLVNKHHKDITNPTNKG